MKTHNDNQNKCPEQEVIEDYIQSRLGSEAKSDFEKHIETCKACQMKNF